MAAVWEAEDKVLTRRVAIKVLHPHLAGDDGFRTRFRREAVAAARLAHPHIVTTYDTGRDADVAYIVMELVDGTTLARLLKTRGQLPVAQAVDVAVQVADALACAHAHGVVHRDVKPANILLREDGHVKVADFGIAKAGAGGDLTRTGVVMGTAKYLSPEQVSGSPADAGSDIYALGLILYELYSGKPAFTATTVAELREQKETKTPTALSDIRQGVDPIVERLILRCLERDPRARPASTRQLGAALPGGDPLAAAIAAGETPSPEMVAASGGKEGLRPAAAVILLAATLLALLLAAALNAKNSPFLAASPGEPPQALAVRARQLNQLAGHPEPSDSAYGYDYDFDFIHSLRNPDGVTLRADRLSDYSAVSFWFRQGSGPLVGDFGFLGTAGNPAFLQPGETSLLLDNEGRLKRFEAAPRETSLEAGSPTAPNWAQWLIAAGLDPSGWTPAEPQQTPPHFADQRAAWHGSLPYGHHIPARIEAASYHGRLVYFEIMGSWSRPLQSGVNFPSTGVRIYNLTELGFLVVAVLGGLVLARRNLRLGRGDRRGAARIAFTGMVLVTIRWLSLEHHVATLDELVLMMMFVALALTVVAFFWTLYIALEPLVRRRWPHILVTWTRLWMGEWRDPKVGRDVLIGCASGAAYVLLGRVFWAAPAWFGHPAALEFTEVVPPMGTREFLAGLSFRLLVVIAGGLASVLVLFIMRVLLRKDLAAAAVLAVLSALLTGPRTSYIWLDVAAGLLAASLAVFVLFRIGLVAFSALALVDQFFIQFPITLQTSAWYFGLGLAALFIIAGIAVYGFRVSLAGSRLFDLTSIESQ